MHNPGIARPVKSWKELCKEIDALNGAEQAKYIKAQGEKMVNDPSRQYDFLLALEENLIEKKKAQEEAVNVKRQLAELAKERLYPGEVDVVAMTREMQGRMGLGNTRWQSTNDTLNVNFYSETQDRRDNIEIIKNHKSPVIHSGGVSKPTRVLPPFFNKRKGLMKLIPWPQVVDGYAKLLHDADYEVTGDLIHNAKDLQNILKTGQRLPPNQPSAFNAFGKALDGAVSPIVGAASSIMNWGLKGIASHSDPRKDENLIEYRRLRNELVSNLLWKFNPEGTGHGALMQRYKEILKKMNEKDHGLLDHAAYSELLKLIEEEATKANSSYAEQVKGINEKLNKLNEAVYKDAEEHTKATDDMHKWRALQLFLIVAPFAGIAYMGPIVDIFSGVFQNEEGIGAGIAALASSQYLGWFGYIAEALQIDTMIQWLLTDMPLISDVIDVADYIIGGIIMQEALAGVVVPVLSGALMPLIVMGVVSLYRANTEIEHYKKYDGDDGKFAAHQKKLHAEIDAIMKDLKDPDTIRGEKFKKEGEALIKTFTDDIEKQKALKDLFNLGTDMNASAIKAARAKLEEELDAILKGAAAKDKDSKSKIKTQILQNYDQFHEGPNLDSFYDRKMQILEKAHATDFLANFLMQAAQTERDPNPAPGIMPIETSVLGGLLETNDDLLGQLMKSSDGEELDYNDLRDFLSKEENKALREELDKRVLAFISRAGIDAATGNPKDPDDMIDEVEDLLADTDQSKLNDAINQQKNYRRQEFILGLAQQQNIAYDDAIDDAAVVNSAVREREIKRVEAAIKAAEITQMKDVIRVQSGLALDKDQEAIEAGLAPGNAPRIVNGKALFTDDHGHPIFP